MPGSEITRNQTVLGGAAGIALLAFALGYRFLPSFSSTAPVAPAPINVSSPPMTAQTQTPVVPLASVQSSTAAPEPATPVPVVVSPPPPKAIAAMLKKADKAFDEGHLLEPKDHNALAFYQQVLDADKDNATAHAGVTKVHDALLQQANAALERDNENDSVRAIAALASLPHEAASSVTGELDSLRAKLKLLKEISPLLTHAADLLKEGHATEPADDNALSVYRQVIKLDPENKIADQGLAEVERGFLERALAAAAQDDFSGADQTLADASAIRPGSHELLDTRTRIEGIRRQRATNVLAQANTALDGGDADLAQLLEQKALGLSPDLAGVNDFNVRLQNARLYASYKPGQVVVDRFLDRNGAAPSVVVVPTGEFTMGSPAGENGHRANEEPQREVKIAVGFALGRDDVTVAQFRDFVGDSDYVSDSEKLGGSSVYDEESGRMLDHRGASWKDDYLGEKAGDNLPVINISWNDANAYAQWLTTRTGKHYRLPSEAEFEYALRAGAATRFWWGEDNPGKVLANLTGDGDRSPRLKRTWAKSFLRYSDGFWGPSPVGSFPANKFGLHDIDGNVSEWVEDCWHDNYTRAPADSRAWLNPGCAVHVIRGGSWGSAPDQSRSAYRLSAPAETRSARVGMRVARDL